MPFVNHVSFHLYNLFRVFRYKVQFHIYEEKEKSDGKNVRERVEQVKVAKKWGKCERFHRLSKGASKKRCE